MSSYRYPPTGGSGITTYANFAAFPASASNGTVALALDTDFLYAYNTSLVAWVVIGGSGAALSIGTIDSQTASANGAVIASNALVMQSASATRPGLVNITTQSFAGNKTFTGTISASNLSGTNTGDVTLGTASGLSILGQVLSLQLASTTLTGALSSADWNTFNGKQASGSYITALTGDVTASGPGSVAATVALVGGSTAASVNTATVLVNGSQSGSKFLGSPSGGGAGAPAFRALVAGDIPSLSYVTSVAMTVPTFLSIGGSPITSAGTLAVTLSGTALPVANGGTGLTSGTSGGILAYTASGTLASSGALTASQLIIGGGAGVAPSSLAAGSQYQVLRMGASNPAYGSVNLDQSAAVTGILPNANTTAVTTVTASTIALRDANANLSVNNALEGYTTTATAASTTTLTVASTYQQFFTGTSTQTVLLPVASTLVLGQTFQIINNSTGTITVQSSGGNTIQGMAASSVLLLTCILTSGTGTASWNAIYGLGTIQAAVNPTIQKFTSGSGTYTTPNGVQYIRVRMVGAGGGGGGSSTQVAHDGANGTAGGNTTFGTTLLVANGGALGPGSIGNGINGGVGGTASLGTGPIGTAIQGSQGGEQQYLTITGVYAYGGCGGSSALSGSGGGGSAGTAGAAATTNSGSGGGGAGGPSGATGSIGGCGGGSGGYVDAIITSPNSTYSYVIGASGTAGASGTSGFAGGAGGSGYIEVTEYYTNFSVSLSTSVSANTFLAGPSSGSATTPTFRALVAADLPSAIQSITTTSNITTTSTFIKASTAGGAYTATFPVPTSNSGQTYTIRKTTTDLSVLTLVIATSGSFVENGNTTSTTTLNTIGETLVVISDGTNYQIMQRIIPANLGTTVTLTPSAGFGTITNANYQSQRRGNYLCIQGVWKNGTVAGSSANLAISTLTIDSSALTSISQVQSVGTFTIPQNSAGPNAIYSGSGSSFLAGIIFYDGSDTGKIYLTDVVGSAVFTKRNGNNISSTSDYISFYFQIPITGWNS